MLKAEAVKQWEAGKPLVCVEYRSSRVDHIAWRDKTNGRAMEANILRHTVETADGSVSVSERMADDWDGKTFTPPCEKGGRCVLIVSEWRVEKGVISIRGKLEKLT